MVEGGDGLEVMREGRGREEEVATCSRPMARADAAGGGPVSSAHGGRGGAQRAEARTDERLHGGERAEGRDVVEAKQLLHAEGGLRADEDHLRHELPEGGLRRDGVDEEVPEALIILDRQHAEVTANGAEALGVYDVMHLRSHR